jgi:hypothetical protein
VSELADRLVAAYRPYVLGVIDGRGWEAPEDMGSALERGEAWLRDTLDALLSLSFAEQHRGPLEVFQEAMRFPAEALAAAGVPQPVRDETRLGVLPGDVYDLAPASSRALGEEVWQAHLVWGAAKARALTRRTVMTVTSNLIDLSRIREAAASAGMVAAGWNKSELDGAAVVCIDLEQAGARNAIRTCVEAGVPAVAYGPHVAADLLDGARALGAGIVLPRSRFFAQLASGLERWAIR